MKKTWEILAPAGSIEQLKAAVNNGCDSVYLGLENFNARMKAPNFTKDNIREWVDYCHLFGVKVYVTVNTSVKNNEFVDAWDNILKAYRSYADGVIVTDLALMQLAAKLPKPFEVVASTQLNIHDKYGAEFVKKLGATTVVCARECSFDQIKEIAETGITVECFLHGANCVCQSGQCLFSSLVGGNSGNRGLCAQPCRKYYKVKNSRCGGYLLSARDTCGLDTAKKLKELGVHTFKIEGRNRRAEYAGVTSRVYSKFFASGFTQESTNFDDLAEMFNRALAPNNYLFGKNNDIICKEIQNHSGVCVGAVKGNGFVSKSKISKGDGLKVFDGNKEVCGGMALESGNGYIRAAFSGKVIDGMTVCRTTSLDLCNAVISVQKKLSVDMRLVAQIGRKAKLYAKCNDVEIEVESNFAVSKAISAHTTTDEIAVQLQKTGILPYTISNIIYEIDDVFFAKSQLNALRRSALENLTEKLVDKYNSQFSNRNESSIALPVLSAIKSTPSLVAICETSTEAEVARKFADSIIYRPSTISRDTIKDMTDCFVDLPSFADCEYLSSICFGCNVGVVCHNVGQVGFARQKNLPYIAGCGLNIFNDYIANIFSDAKAFIYSLELTLEEISHFFNKSGYAFVDGKIALMKLVHCPYKVAYGCDCKTCCADRSLTYVDEFGNEFNIQRRKDKNCSFELINGRKVSVVGKLYKNGRYMIDYDKNVLLHYYLLNHGETDNYVETQSCTKGRLYSKIN